MAEAAGRHVHHRSAIFDSRSHVFTVTVNIHAAAHGDRCHSQNQYAEANAPNITAAFVMSTT